MRRPRRERRRTRRSRLAVARFNFFQAAATAAAAIAAFAGAGTFSVDASSAGTTTPAAPSAARRRAGETLVFRVEGSRDDPEFVRACGVVKGLEDLYGKERYLLHPVPDEDSGSSEQVRKRKHSPRRRSSWLPQWLCGSSRSRSSPASSSSAKQDPTATAKPRPRAVLCSINSSPVAAVAPGDRAPTPTAQNGAESRVSVGGSPVDVADTSVAIGGAEELLEFVRNSVLAGPRPFSFAFHEQSLRIKEAQRRKGGGMPSPPRDTSEPPVTSGRAALRGSNSSSNGGTSTAAKSNDKAGEEGPFSTPDTGGVASAASTTGVSSAESEHKHRYHYDLVVIGGGSGGLACAKEAARLGQRVACLDFVKPSGMGSKWGLGGTCVNVGCIPKKLMHQASLLAGHMQDAPFFGWRRDVDEEGDFSAPGQPGQGAAVHDWGGMVQGVQNFIKGMNFKYRTDLRSQGVEYINALGRLQDAHNVIATDKNGKERVLSCGCVVVAVGGRPNNLPCEGGELAITSDDIFSLKRHPGKTLVVGASYVALECAGFLTGLGVDTTVMVRSILLRGFDQGIAERIGSFMEAEGTRFLRPAVPHRISKTEGGRLLVSWTEGDDKAAKEEEFDTVLAATGRTADTQGLGLENIGVTLTKSGKMVCRNEETTLPGVFGIGDAVHGVPELTPSAIQAGRLLAMRLFGGSTRAMDYSNVCTTVFTPLEYGCCGLSEDEAIMNLGEENVEVFHSAFTPLEWQLNSERPQNACYVKAVCDLTDKQRVLGLHFLGPNAGEVMQGFGLGIRLGMTFDDLRQLVGIHPTVAEELTVLQTTRRSGEPIEKSAC
eukprot:g8153.t1